MCLSVFCFYLLENWRSGRGNSRAATNVPYDQDRLFREKRTLPTTNWVSPNFALQCTRISIYMQIWKKDKVIRFVFDSRERTIVKVEAIMESCNRFTRTLPSLRSNTSKKWFDVYQISARRSNKLTQCLKKGISKLWEIPRKCCGKDGKK